MIKKDQEQKLLLKNMSKAVFLNCLYYLELYKLDWKDLSEITGISGYLLRQQKRRGTIPKYNQILKLCEVLNITPVELTDFEKALKKYLEIIESKWRNDNEIFKY